MLCFEDNKIIWLFQIPASAKLNAHKAHFITIILVNNDIIICHKGTSQQLVFETPYFEVSILNSK